MQIVSLWGVLLKTTSHTAIQTLLGAAILVLASLSFHEIRALRTETDMQGNQSITTVVDTQSVTTDRGTSESIADWLDRHKEALAAL